MINFIKQLLQTIKLKLRYRKYKSLYEIEEIKYLCAQLKGHKCVDFYWDGFSHVAVYDRLKPPQSRSWMTYEEWQVKNA